MKHDEPQIIEEATEEDAPHKHFGSGKGFYAVLAICLVAVGGVAAATFTDTLTQTASISESETTASTRALSTAARTTTALAAAAQTAASETVTTETQPTETAASAETTAAQTALFILPLSNEVVQPFSESPVFSETMGDYRTHKGVDYGGSEGQAVRALADGVIAQIKEDALWGGVMTLDHGSGILSVYCGVSSEREPGEEVKVGDEIGTLSGVPCEQALAAHLHLELYQDGEAVDATALLGGQVPIG